MASRQDEDALINDGIEMAKIVAMPGFGAILRLLKRKRDDLFESWSSDKADAKFTKDFCNGQLELIRTFEADVRSEIESAHRLLEEREEQERGDAELARVSRTPGGGDLAL